MTDIARDTMKALHKMGKMAHTQKKEPAAVRSVFLDCPCTKCIDGGIDMPHCVDCSRSNGFPYFRKKVER
jgi:hypothetical protein